jgi:predicted ester cyclase
MGTSQEVAMATLDNAAILREVYEAWNKKDLDRVASYAAPDARITVVPFGSKMTVREYEENWARAFPDGKIEMTNLVSQGDLVVAEFTGRGTHTGPLQGPGGEIAPTGRRAELQCVECLRFRNGKITEGRAYFDSATLMAQLGMAAGATEAQGRATATTPQPRH